MKNREGHADFDWPDDPSKFRLPGLSGLLRLRDEAVWCCLAIESFLDWLDELIVVVQPSSDGTRELVEPYRGDKVAIYDYPFLTWPNGPGHGDRPADSVHSSSWYYNWTLSKSSCTHVVKLDGDLVMMDGAGTRIRAAMRGGHDRIKFRGVNIVSDDLRHVGSQPDCPTDGVYRVTKDTRYRPGAMSEKLTGAPPPTLEIKSPLFLHFKFARKSEESITKAWPANWRETEHFRRIWARREPVALYEGEYPGSIKALL